MNQNKIVPCSLDFELTWHDILGHRVVRVFDTNGYGEMLPVQFSLNADGTQFTLLRQPAGKVFAELEANPPTKKETT